MLVIQIALGIVLAILILRYLKGLLTLAAIVALMLVLVAFAYYLKLQGVTISDVLIFALMLAVIAGLGTIVESDGKAGFRFTVRRWRELLTAASPSLIPVRTFVRRGLTERGSHRVGLAYLLMMLVIFASPEGPLRNPDRPPSTTSSVLGLGALLLFFGTAIDFLLQRAIARRRESAATKPGASSRSRDK